MRLYKNVLSVYDKICLIEDPTSFPVKLTKHWLVDYGMQRRYNLWNLKNKEQLH